MPELRTMSVLARLLAVFAASTALTVLTPVMQHHAMAQETSMAGAQKAVFAGGCFWCLEADFGKLKGVLDAVSGYAGGTSASPTYKNYAKGGHIEVVEVSYDPAQVTYGEIVEYFWRQIDPTDAGGQFCDRGHEYSSAIFYGNDEQRQIAETSKASLGQSGALPSAVATQILQLNRFWPAETYHQDYARKHPLRYRYYRRGCKRDARIKEVWSKQPS